LRPASAVEERRLVDAFCEYHAEVVLMKRQVVAAPAAMPYDAIQQRLLDTFEVQAARVTQSLPEHEARLFEETRYVMIAMADEVFLSMEWPGKGDWANKPLEAIVFQTRDAGERFFRRIDDTLAGRAAASSQMLTVYITALALGFRGKFAALGTNEPETFRKRLSEYIARIDPDLVRAEELCPQAHENTLDKETEKRLPSFSRGVLPFLLVILAWVVVGEILWFYRTAEIDDVLDRIEDAT
jgi:type VI secretion system protein ImpK